MWIFDHFFYQPPDGPVEGVHEAWSVVSAVAAVTTRVQIGTLVLCSPFRNPALVAKMAATADEISGGRLILGVGAGWHDPEFTAFGYPSHHRVARFAEALPILTGLLGGASVTAVGRYHQVRDAKLVPPPGRRIPVLVAAEGPRMLGQTARHADAWNTAWYGRPDDRLSAQLAALRQALEEEGRDPATLTRTVGIQVHDPQRAPLPGDPVVSGSVSDLARALDDYAPSASTT